MKVYCCIQVSSHQCHSTEEKPNLGKNGIGYDFAIFLFLTMKLVLDILTIVSNRTKEVSKRTTTIIIETLEQNTFYLGQIKFVRKYKRIEQVGRTSKSSHRYRVTTIEFFSFSLELLILEQLYLHSNLGVGLPKIVEAPTAYGGRREQKFVSPKIDILYHATSSFEVFIDGLWGVILRGICCF